MIPNALALIVLVRTRNAGIHTDLEFNPQYMPNLENNENPIAKMKQCPHEPTLFINHSIAQPQPSTAQSSGPSTAAPPLYHSPATSPKDRQTCPPPPSQQLSHSWLLRQNTQSPLTPKPSLSPPSPLQT